MQYDRNTLPHERDTARTDGAPTESTRRFLSVRHVLLGLLGVALAVGGLIGVGWWTSRYPAAINMSSACAPEAMHPMDMGSMGAMCPLGSISATPATGIPIASLQAPLAAAHTDTFTLTAQPAQLEFGAGVRADAWTFNGAAPGPTLRVRQGDLVVVQLINHLSVAVTIHWHGVAVPNSADGVAGITQDAVKPGETYTYRFLAKDPGTYWYHSHQESFAETSRGLYGLLIVEPATPVTHDDVDVGIVLHSWGAIAINDTVGTLRIPAQPGQWVRLRLLNTDNYPYQLTVVGAPFLVAALDGHELNEPTRLTATAISIDAAQRYDLRVRMPERGPVALLVAKDGAQQYQPAPAARVGAGALDPSVIPSGIGKAFDMTTYGQPQSQVITAQSHFDATYTVTVGYSVGFSNGRPGPVFTLNGAVFPQTSTIVVQPGQVVKFHLVSDAASGIHPMHLHGHTFTVLAKDERPLTGSPVYLDTISLRPHETYDVAFVADNPGLWMFHCHNLYHANHGMDMMVVYPNITTPYTIGSASGNFPD
jgi:FtsP/CotA-like multicopper oxidase with cupredoxin domain